MKLVSVIIPTYKRPSFLKRAINSVLLQSYSNVEVIVVDDNNDDDQYRQETMSVMQEFESNNKVKYLKHHRNKNGSSARNTGLKEAHGDYISFLDDDDYFLTDRLINAVKYLEMTGLDIGGCCVNYIKRYKNLIYRKSDYDCVSCDCSNLLSGRVDYGAGSTLMIKRVVIDEVIGFDESYKKHQDWEFLIRVFRKFKIVNLPDLGVVICIDGYRNNPNIDVIKGAKDKIFTEFANDIKKLDKNCIHEIFKAQYNEMLVNYISAKKYKDAICFFKSNIKEIDWNITRIPRIIIAVICSYIPSFMLLIYFIYNLKHYSLHKSISQSV